MAMRNEADAPVTNAELPDYDSVRSHELPVAVAELVDEYEDRNGERDRFLWKWIHTVLPDVTLRSVPQRHRSRVVDAKLVCSMYVVVLDDVGEKDGDKATLDEAAKIPFPGETAVERPGVDGETLAMARNVWSTFESIVADRPGRPEFLDVLEFDLRQTINAIRYSVLVNENLAMANVDETWAYDCHNMMIFPYLDIDLLFSPTFDLDDLSAVRRATLRTQQMARIGNWVTTWEREIPEGDFTAGVVVAALQRGVVTRSELAGVARGEVDPAPIVGRIQDEGLEDEFLDEWAAIREEVWQFEPMVDSVDLGAYLDGMEALLGYHLASRGFK